ncbi:ABC transporter ATP-binding protein [Candidatus Nanosalina sp. VS9-1]|uniref:ABC transporter ATP-binding protein n=1 Tax=Candidatus Nanosalina sp. VS9-1 TaxID=3388566 RepID=UPI0039DFA3E2
MSLIEVKGLKKSFGDVKALDGIDLEVEEGEIVGVLGPNGAGKSTLIQILTGQMKSDAGTAEILGIDPSENPVEAREKMGILPEREDPPSFLTGSEYLDFVSDTRDTEIDKQAWIERLNMEGKMDSQTRNLSKGERQKLMITQAFFHDPEIVFIDEPLVNLDPVVQEEAKKVFKERRDNGGTVFLCTHVISLAEEVCDRVFFLKDGKITREITEVENLKEKFLEDQ